MHNPVTRATIPLDAQRVIRPWSHPDSDQDAAVLHWQSLLAAGLIGNTPPAPPAVIAQREANDALFRGFSRDRAPARQYAQS